jgi:hypothetical protein
MNSRMTAAERCEHWARFLQSEEGRSWDFSLAVFAIIEASFSHLEMIFGDKAVAAPLARILKEAAAAEGEEGSTWRERLDSAGPLSCGVWPITRTLRELGLYGRYGVTEAHIPPVQREAHIGALLRACEAFLRTSPVTQLGPV